MFFEMITLIFIIMPRAVLENPLFKLADGGKLIAPIMPGIKIKFHQPFWTIAGPICAWILFAGTELGLGIVYSFLLAAALIFSVLAAVHHAEVVSHRVGEPFGALVLAVAVTTIEVALIISLMLSPGHGSSALARDTVFATEMIIITGIVGGCLLLGGIRFKVQTFGLDGVSAALTVLTAISVLTLVLPNYTTSVPGPFYSNKQLAFVAIVSLGLYAIFLIVQTISLRDYFLPEKDKKAVETAHIKRPTNGETVSSIVFLLISLGAVVMLAESLAPGIEAGVDKIGAPKSLVGIIIAMVVLLPEALSAFRAAGINQLHSSLNFALGSALASVGLTIPIIAFVAVYKRLPLSLGIDTKSTVLFLLSLFIILLSLRTGRTTLLQGVILLVIFAVYLFTTIVP
jgi:Ca2+:H+ antiporter